MNGEWWNLQKEANQMADQFYRPKHLTGGQYGFLAGVSHDRGRKQAAHADAVQDHEDAARDLDTKSTVTEADDYVNHDDDPSAIDDARHRVESKTRELQRRSRSLDYQHLQRTIAAGVKAEERRPARSGLIGFIPRNRSEHRASNN
jgi:hypothetical protein